LSFAEAPQVLPVKNLLFKLQIFGNTEEYPEGHKHLEGHKRRLPVRVKRHGCPLSVPFLHPKGHKDKQERNKQKQIIGRACYL